jgi:alpha-N-arabinofuranosidase
MISTYRRNAARRGGFGKLTGAFAVCGVAAALTAADMPSADALAHRWSFTGNAKDSVTGRDARTIGLPTFSHVVLKRGGAYHPAWVTLPGGKHNAGHFDLGECALPADADGVTVEIWATPKSIRKWSRIFDYGSDSRNYFCMGWNCETDSGTDGIELCNGGTKYSAMNRLNPYALGTKYHITVTFVNNKDGSMTMRAMRRNAKTGAIEREHRQLYRDWTLATFVRPHLLLGGSQYSIDDDAEAEYDEVRVWRAALTDEQLAANVVAGPDVLPAKVSFRTGRDVKPIPAFIFGQNIEHTRSALQGGLSAQLVRNRKFAGKPSRKGVAMLWEPYGSRAFYHNGEWLGVVRHAARSRMPRKNEHAAQVIGCLDEKGEAGVRQDGVGIRGGVSHNFRAVVSTLHPVDTPVVLRVKSGGRVLAEREFVVNAKTRKDWKRIAFDFKIDADVMAEVSVGVKGRKYCIVGAVSVMPADNFHGMRADVIENLRDIGTSIVRWPGGNFAGEYRWRDGLIADPDERAPLEAFTNIESQPHGLGFDQNDIGMEDILALCDRIGAKPFFTLNAAWEGPQDSADWVKACRGRVKMWSLGNEMGYAHMEGPKGAGGYTQMVRPHAEAMLKVDPSLEITASGPYPGGGKEWIEKSAKALDDVAPTVSYHRYDSFNACIFDYSTPESIEALFAYYSQRADYAASAMTGFRSRLPWNIGISYDEWNIWYTWYREEAIVEGLYAAKMIGHMMRNWEAWGLKYVCYFQPINEQAINVSPFESHLTSLGEAMRLWKGHVGGVPAPIADMPSNAFATDAADGSRYMTFYNFSTVKPCSFRISAGGREKIVAEETLVPNGFETGHRYARKPGLGRIAGGFYELVLGPACQASVRIAR